MYVVNPSPPQSLYLRFLACLFLLGCRGIHGFIIGGRNDKNASPKTTLRLDGMKRPFLDQLASTLFRLETDRVAQSSVVDEQGRKGEPMEWSEADSIANRFSQLVAGNSLGYVFKQWVADIVAGNDYDEEQVSQRIDDFVNDHSVAMFSFTTCPFCRRAKDLLYAKGVPYASLELDELDGNSGNEIRAVLGRKTKRTSVPCIFIQGKCIGGCNDGSPGLFPLEASGELDRLLQEVVTIQ